MAVDLRPTTVQPYVKSDRRADEYSIDPLDSKSSGYKRITGTREGWWHEPPLTTPQATPLPDLGTAAERPPLTDGQPTWKPKANDILPRIRREEIILFSQMECYSYFICLVGVSDVVLAGIALAVSLNDTDQCFLTPSLISFIIGLLVLVQGFTVCITLNCYVLRHDETPQKPANPPRSSFHGTSSILTPRSPMVTTRAISADSRSDSRSAQSRGLDDPSPRQADQWGDRAARDFPSMDERIGEPLQSSATLNVIHLDIRQVSLGSDDVHTPLSMPSLRSARQTSADTSDARSGAPFRPQPVVGHRRSKDHKKTRLRPTITTSLPLNDDPPPTDVEAGVEVTPAATSGGTLSSVLHCAFLASLCLMLVVALVSLYNFLARRGESSANTACAAEYFPTNTTGANQDINAFSFTEWSDLATLVFAGLVVLWAPFTFCRIRKLKDDEAQLEPRRTQASSNSSKRTERRQGSSYGGPAMRSSPGPSVASSMSNVDAAGHLMPRDDEHLPFPPGALTKGFSGLDRWSTQSPSRGHRLSDSDPIERITFEESVGVVIDDPRNTLRSSLSSCTNSSDDPVVGHIYDVSAIEGK